MRPCWLGKSQTMREARLSKEGGDERGGMAGPRGDFAEDDPGGIGRLPYYGVPRLKRGFGLCQGRRPKWITIDSVLGKPANVGEVRLHQEPWSRDERETKPAAGYTSHRVSQNDQVFLFFVGVQKIGLDLELVLGWDKSSAKTPSAGLASVLVGRPKVQSGREVVWFARPRPRPRVQRNV